jgi:hypothetical protein
MSSVNSRWVAVNSVPTQTNNVLLTAHADAAARRGWTRLVGAEATAITQRTPKYHVQMLFVVVVSLARVLSAVCS